MKSGTFKSDISGTFVSDTSGTFGVIYSETLWQIIIVSIVERSILALHY